MFPLTVFLSKWLVRDDSSINSLLSKNSNTLSLADAAPWRDATTCPNWVRGDVNKRQ